MQGVSIGTSFPFSLTYTTLSNGFHRGSIVTILLQTIDLGTRKL